MHIARALLLVSCLFGSLASLGCGVPTTPLSGSVEFKGQPLPGGTVAFFGEDNSVHRAAIGANAKYSLDKIPVGRYRVTVATPWIPPAVKKAVPSSEAPKPPPVDPAFPATLPVPELPKSIAIPARYNDPATSDLVVDVVREMPAYDIKLVE